MSPHQFRCFAAAVSSLSFALALQRALPVRLSAVDMAHTFHVALQDFHSVAELQRAVCA